jgi:hypothetical protein
VDSQSTQFNVAISQARRQSFFSSLGQSLFYRLIPGPVSSNQALMCVEKYAGIKTVAGAFQSLGSGCKSNLKLNAKMFLSQNHEISSQDKVFQAVLHDPSFRQYGFAAASFEYNDDPIFQNMLTGLGFAYGLACTIRLYKAATCQHCSPHPLESSQPMA